VSRHIKHVVTEILAPWGPSIEERPPVMSAEERMAKYKAAYDAKRERRDRERKGESEDDRVEGVVEGTAVAS